MLNTLYEVNVNRLNESHPSMVFWHIYPYFDIFTLFLTYLPLFWHIYPYFWNIYTYFAYIYTYFAYINPIFLYIPLFWHLYFIQNIRLHYFFIHCDELYRVMWWAISCHVMSDIVSCDERYRVMWWAISCHVMSYIVSCDELYRVMWWAISCHVMSDIVSCDERYRVMRLVFQPDLSLFCLILPYFTLILPLFYPYFVIVTHISQPTVTSSITRYIVSCVS